ncbi:MAG: LuxR C-terminal-related transcriptional regulator [Chloroflexota bacterium]|nr:LuxR C-terminal-related transcriptional regulator [Chloroflexota bacterium]
MGNTEQFGTWLKERRKQSDLTQAELAGQVGCSPETIQKLETGKRRPSKQMSELLATALDIAGDDLPAFLRSARGESSYDEKPVAANIPLQLTTFVGREREISDVKTLLGKNRLLTLTGTGGCGKTRLAIKVASSVDRMYLDGVYFVELSRLNDPSLVPQAVATAVQMKEQRHLGLASMLTGYLQARNILLVLDNCEHLLAACAELADELLRTCPHLTLIATSRQSLGLRYEVSWHVPPMSLPEATADIAPAHLGEYESVRLFLDRARLRRPDFCLTTQNAPAVAAICCKLDGLPLALELAAARVNVLAVEQIANRLDERFRLLKRADTDQGIEPRQQTLQAAVDWSYNLLNSNERMLLRQLSIFAGSFSLQAVSAICSGEIDEYETLDLLAQLVDKSFVHVTEHENEARYFLLETMRQYGWEKLNLSRELPDIRNRFLNWYRDLAEHAEPRLQTAEQPHWLQLLEGEIDNIRAALTWAIELEDMETGCRTAGALWWFWCIRGYISEGRDWLKRLLSITAAEEHQPVRAKALMGAGVVCTIAGDMQAAQASLEECLLLLGENGNTKVATYAMGNLGWLLSLQGDPRGYTLAEKSRLQMLEQDDLWALGMTDLSMAETAFYRGDYAGAWALAVTALEEVRQSGDHSLLASCLQSTGSISLSRGDYETTARQYAESLQLVGRLGSTISNAGSLAAVAIFASTSGHGEEASKLFAASHAMYKSLNATPQMQNRLGFEQHLEATKSQLGDRAWSAAWLEGGEMTAEQAIEYAISTAQSLARAGGSSPRSEPGDAETTAEQLPTATPDGLTAREVEVLRLIATGRSVRDVAEQLSLSAWTVQAHIRGIYGKLGIATRSAATLYAVSHKLV